MLAPQPLLLFARTSQGTEECDPTDQVLDKDGNGSEEMYSTASDSNSIRAMTIYFMIVLVVSTRQVASTVQIS